MSKLRISFPHPPLSSWHSQSHSPFPPPILAPQNQHTTSPSTKPAPLPVAHPSPHPSISRIQLQIQLYAITHAIIEQAELVLERPLPLPLQQNLMRLPPDVRRYHGFERLDAVARQARDRGFCAQAVVDVDDDEGFGGGRGGGGGFGGGGGARGARRVRGVAVAALGICAVGVACARAGGVVGASPAVVTVAGAISLVASPHAVLSPGISIPAFVPKSAFTGAAVGGVITAIAGRGRGSHGNMRLRASGRSALVVRRRARSLPRWCWRGSFHRKPLPELDFGGASCVEGDAERERECARLRSAAGGEGKGSGIAGGVVWVL
ncbi:hypothetical protein MRB53_041295 [Persea americana]|nr:hypothetical protein MRB53_041295 [Persea americana]